MSKDRLPEFAIGEQGGGPPPLPRSHTASEAARSQVPPPFPGPSTAAPVNSGPARSSGAGQILKRVLAEARWTFAACAAQVGRTISFLRARAVARNAEREALLATEALGRKLDASGMGEATFRSQLAQLRERRQSVEAASASTKLLDAEERGLRVRMATPFLDSPSAPAELEPELGEARRHQSLLVTSQERRAAQRLFPEDRANRFRVAGGLLIAVLLIWLGSRSYFAVGPDSIAVAKGTKKEVWFEENDNWPRRRAVGIYDGDIPQGEVKFYDGRDRLMASLRYKDGKLHGQCTSFYPSGAKFEEGNHVDGLPTGMQRVWFENGKLARTSETAEGEKHGEQICYYANGNKATVGRNERGKLEGKMDMYSPDGRRCNVIIYANGEMVKDEELIHVPEGELQKMVERSKFQYQLKAHWQ